jgi:hypothetical protein
MELAQSFKAKRDGLLKYIELPLAGSYSQNTGHTLKPTLKFYKGAGFTDLLATVEFTLTPGYTKVEFPNGVEVQNGVEYRFTLGVEQGRKLVWSSNGAYRADPVTGQWGIDAYPDGALYHRWTPTHEFKTYPTYNRDGYFRTYHDTCETVTFTVSVTFNVDFDAIAEKLDAFKNAIRKKLAAIMKIALSRITNIRVRRGSVIVDFEIAGGTDEEVAELQKQVDSEEGLTFEFEGEEISAASASILQVETTTDSSGSSGGGSSDNAGLIAGVIIAVIIVLALVLVVALKLRSSQSAAAPATVEPQVYHEAPKATANPAYDHGGVEGGGEPEDGYLDVGAHTDS